VFLDDAHELVHVLEREAFVVTYMLDGTAPGDGAPLLVQGLAPDPDNEGVSVTLHRSTPGKQKKLALWPA
jgi:hypothetical protein